MDSELFHQWFLAGHSPGERQSVTGWATDKIFQGGPVPLEALLDYVYSNKRTASTANALTEKGETLLRGDPDVQPMDIGAATAGSAPVQQKACIGPAQGSSAPR